MKNRKKPKPKTAGRAPATLRRDAPLIARALDALVAHERAETLAWARAHVRVADAQFSGSVDQLVGLHEHSAIGRVGALVELEREVADLRGRLGGAG